MPTVVVILELMVYVTYLDIPCQFCEVAMLHVLIA